MRTIQVKNIIWHHPELMYIVIDRKRVLHAPPNSLVYEATCGEGITRKSLERCMTHSTKSGQIYSYKDIQLDLNIAKYQIRTIQVRNIIWHHPELMYIVIDRKRVLHAPLNSLVYEATCGQ